MGRPQQKSSASSSCASAAQISRPNRADVRLRQKQIRKRELRAIVAMREKLSARADRHSCGPARDSVFTAPTKLLAAPQPGLKDRPDLKSPRNCYVCKAEYTKAAPLL
jgi:hypothetical protein